MDRTENSLAEIPPMEYDKIEFVLFILKNVAKLLKHVSLTNNTIKLRRVIQGHLRPLGFITLKQCHFALFQQLQVKVTYMSCSG